MTLTRRNLLLGAGGALGLAAVTGIGWQFRPTSVPVFPRSGGPGARILVTYASMTGSTGEQAAWLAAAFEDQGHTVHLVPVASAPDPGAYEAVLLGSAIRAGAWLDDIVAWAGRHGEVLSNMPTALFQASMTAAGYLAAEGDLPAEALAALEKDRATLLDAAPGLSPSPIAYLPGRLDYAYLSPMLRIGYPIVSGGFFFGDHRDRTRVTAYADALAGRLG